MDLSKIARKAETSAFYRMLLSKGLGMMVPFNKPHKFKVVSISSNYLRIKLPYRKRNLNHLKGLHACALATLAELTSGLLLISQLKPEKYRLILKKLEMEYEYQAKEDAFAEFRVDEGWLQSAVTEPLQTEDSVLLHCEVKLSNESGKLLATGIVYWQIKAWDKVKTKV